MTVLTRLLERAGAAARSVPLSSDDPLLRRLLGGWVPTAAGVEVSEETAMRLTAVLSAVELDSSTVAGLPIKVWRDMNGERTEQDSSLFKDPMNAELDLTWFEGLEFLVRSWDLYGNAYAFKVRNDLGDKVVRLIPIRPEDCRPYLIRTEAGPEKRFRLQGVTDPLTAADILHVPGLSYDGCCGQSRILIAREAIGSAIAAEETGARLFNSGLMNGGVLQTDAELDEHQAELTKRRWMEKIAGVAKAYEVAVLDRGVKFTPATIPPKDAQWLEARQFGIAEVARIFRQPPALLFEYMATGNVEADKLGNQWLRFGFNQLLSRFERRLSMHLLPRGQFVEFVRAGLLQGTPKEQAEVEAIQITSGVLTVDEARALHNRPPLGATEPEPEPTPEEDPAQQPPEEEKPANAD